MCMNGGGSHVPTRVLIRRVLEMTDKGYHLPPYLVDYIETFVRECREAEAEKEKALRLKPTFFDPFSEVHRAFYGDQEQSPRA